MHSWQPRNSECCQFYLHQTTFANISQQKKTSDPVVEKKPWIELTHNLCFLVKILKRNHLSKRSQFQWNFKMTSVVSATNKWRCSYRCVNLQRASWSQSDSSGVPTTSYIRDALFIMCWVLLLKRMHVQLNFTSVWLASSSPQAQKLMSTLIWKRTDLGEIGFDSKSFEGN